MTVILSEVLLLVKLLVVKTVDVETGSYTELSGWHEILLSTYPAMLKRDVISANYSSAGNWEVI